MLNVFLHFLNSFLLCLFFLAGLIPPLLQKSPLFGLLGAKSIIKMHACQAGLHPPLAACLGVAPFWRAGAVRPRTNSLQGLPDSGNMTP